MGAALKSSQPGPVPEEHPEYRPSALAGTDFPDKPRYVLNENTQAPVHLRMAAFGLGTRTFDFGTAALGIQNRASPFTLVARSGAIIAILHT